MNNRDYENPQLSSFFQPLIGENTRLNFNQQKPQQSTKCTCVPSGRCHSHTLTGCPHRHYFNENNVWTCKN